MLHHDRRRMTDEQCEQAFEALERNADVLTRLVNDVLDTSRIVTGKVRLTLAACRLEEVVSAAVETIAPAAEAKGVTIDTHLEQHLEVLGDRDRLQQVLWNVLANAVKFTPSGGTIMVNGRVTGGQVEIAVRDTGIGIREEQLPFIFQRFWQGNRGVSREYSGLGLGLAFARHLVELHGGAIAAESAGAGKGSLFTITLPTQGKMLARERNLRTAGR
jgi:signal transduction histidine kinase